MLSNSHSQHTWKLGKQQQQNKYRPQFQKYGGKTLSFKSSTTKQNFFEFLLVLQCKQSASTCKGPVSNKLFIQRFHSKAVPPNRIFLSYPQYFNVSQVHRLVSTLFPTNPISKEPLTGRLKLFHSNGAKLTQDPNILNFVQGFEIPFRENPMQGKSSDPPLLNQKQSKLVKEELTEMLLTGAIQPVSPCKNQYLSNLFLVSKRGQQTTNKLEISEQFDPILAFQNGGTEFITKYAPKAKGRLQLQAGPKRHIHLCSFKKRNQGNM